MKFGFRTRSRSSESSPIGLLIFGTIWTLFSGIFVVVGLYAMYDGGSKSAWTKVPCVIEKCEILDNPAEDKPFAMDVAFRYVVDGREYTGTRWQAQDARHEDYHKLAAECAEVLAGDGTLSRAEREPVCRVNPKDPADAVLTVSGESIIGGLVFTIFGGCFVLIGLGMLVTAVKGIIAKRASDNGRASLTEEKSGADEPGLILYPFFGLFAIAGLGILFGVIFPSWQKYFAAKSWFEVPAEVIWSKVTSHSGDDSTTYSCDIFYRYDFEGKKYKSDKGSFFDGSSGGRDAKEKLANAHPKGKSITVFVNPEKPWQAVRERDMGAQAWFTLFPLPFIAVGCGGLFWLIRKRKTKDTVTGGMGVRRAATATRASSSGNATGLSGSPAGPASGQSLRLAPGKGRVAKAAGLLFVTLFWNGIVSVFLYHLFGEWRAGSHSWFLAVFLVPFVLIGLGIIAAFIHQVGALFNPKPVLTIDPGHIRLGHSVSVRWEIPHGASRLRDLRITLRGEEVATCRRGKNSVTERATFFEKEITHAGMESMIAGGHAALTLPEDLVPSWSAANNRIEWTMDVRATIPLWPDISDSHVVTVHAR